jgi:uncharacterized protein involved in exopolysaccharide biosynthesis
MTPVVEQQFKEIMRDYQVASEDYNDLLKKRDQAAMSSRLEQAQQSEQFHVLDSPNLPERPAFPDWRMFSAGGFMFGFLLGAVFSGMLEFQDKTLRTEREVELLLKVPALAILPVFESSGQKRGSFLDAFRPTPKVAKV